MSTLKYKLRLDLKKEVFGRTLYRIENLKTGHLGGWVETEANLDQEGNAPVSRRVGLHPGASLTGA